MGNGTTGQTSLSNKDLGKMLIPLPPRNIQDKFGNCFKTIIDKISSLMLENDALKRLCDSLLPKLLDGSYDESLK